MRSTQGRLRNGPDLSVPPAKASFFTIISGDEIDPDQWRNLQGACRGRQQHHPPECRDLSQAGGHEVLLADDGFDALAKVNDYQPQLIFCDILMPKLDGYQTCAIIKRNARFADTPVVMLSSKDGVFDKARGRMVGCQEYLTKPFTKDRLLKAVQQFGNAQQGAM